MAEKIVPYSPTFPYNGNQIIIDSGRVLLNAKEEAVLILGKKTIGLSTQGSINFDTSTSFIVNSPKIKLGIGTNSDSPLIRGDVLVEVLDEIMRILGDSLANQLKDSIDSQGMHATELRMIAVAFSKLPNIINDSKDRLLSKTSYTK
tara:strand:- start:14349 stop:14789 length:441 start_codon:yes stop_codon:yes gene_type:complete